MLMLLEVLMAVLTERHTAKESRLSAKLAHVAFTNGRAKRGMRMGKRKRKVPGCFRTSQYAGAG